MTDILNRIDNAIDGLCPCGGQPRTSSPYCSADCEPTHIAAHTDTRMSGHLATAMRWRPDLIHHATPRPIATISAEQIVSMVAAAQTVRAAFAHVANAVAVATRNLSSFATQLQAAKVIPETPPTDPMARALWLRQHRNTGPAPHRLDGRRQAR